LKFIAAGGKEGPKLSNI